MSEQNMQAQYIIHANMTNREVVTADITLYPSADFTTHGYSVYSYLSVLHEFLNISTGGQGPLFASLLLWYDSSK